MSLKHKFLRIIVMYTLTMILIYLMTPMAKDYPSISYYTFKGDLENSEIDAIYYSADDKFAIVRNGTEDEEYKLSIISTENFEKDIYEYSLRTEKFVFEKYQPPVRLNFIIQLFAVILFNIMGYSIWNAIYKAVHAKRSFQKINFKEYDESKKRKKDDKNRLFTGGSLNLLSGFQPRIVGNTGITFKDVIGLDKQMDELQDIVRFLKEPEKYEKIGAVLPKGILLFGKPGVGKTHIARAIAGEAEVPFFEISASELNAKYLGESEERIRSIFKAAEEKAPAIIYIDEIDSIAVKRYSNNSNKYGASILNQLLACMDGFSKDSNVIVIAATNHENALDDAILRSGRFDRKIYIHTPDKEARRQLIDYYSSDKQVSDEVNIERLVDITVGLTGADIKTILNEAALLSVRRGEEKISEEAIMEAFRKVEIGTQNNFSHNSKEQLERTAIHESGHAIISKHFGQNVSEVSIISRGSAAGYNLATGDEEADYNFNELKHRIMVLLAGRAAEEEMYSEVSAGASNDLERASAIVRDMFLRYSMRDEKGVNMVLTDSQELNEVIVRESYGNMDGFLKSCYEETKKILIEKKALLTKLSKELLNKETLSKYDIERILDE